jgi:hypothetical protein
MREEVVGGSRSRSALGKKHETLSEKEPKQIHKKLTSFFFKKLTALPNLYDIFIHFG